MWLWLILLIKNGDSMLLKLMILISLGQAKPTVLLIDGAVEINKDNAKYIKAIHSHKSTMHITHGTAMLGFILFDGYTTKPIDPLCDVDVTSCNMYAGELAYNGCLELAIKNKYDVVNMSFNGTKPYLSEYLMINKISKYSKVVVASGNEGQPYENYYPAGYKARGIDLFVIMNDTSKMSNYGPKLIKIDGTNKRYRLNNKIQKMTGTSVSAARYSHKLLKDLCKGDK